MMELGTGFREEAPKMIEALERDLDAYESQLGELKAKYGDKWVIFKGGKFQGAFATYDQAVTHGLSKLGDVDFLLRQIEDRPVNIPMLFVKG